MHDTQVFINKLLRSKNSTTYSTAFQPELQKAPKVTIRNKTDARLRSSGVGISATQGTALSLGRLTIVSTSRATMRLRPADRRPSDGAHRASTQTRSPVQFLRIVGLFLSGALPKTHTCAQAQLGKSDRLSGCCCYCCCSSC